MLEIIFHSPIILKVAYVTAAVVAISLAITFLCIATEAHEDE